MVSPILKELTVGMRHLPFNAGSGPLIRWGHLAGAWLVRAVWVREPRDSR